MNKPRIGQALFGLTLVIATAAFVLVPSSSGQDPAAPPSDGKAGFGGKGGGGKGGAPGRGGAKGGGAPAPPAGPIGRAPDGHPDFSGYWNPADQGNIEATPGRGGGGRGNIIIDPADGMIPYKPEARAKQKDLMENHLADEPELNCYQSGVPHSESNRFGMQLIQTAGYLVQMEEFLHSVRVIPTDGRPHIDAKHHLFQGDPVGHWEGDTLVVDTTNQNDKTWFDLSGNFKTNGLHVTEKFSAQDANTLVYEATMTDPAIYTAPWSARWTIPRDRTAANSDGHPHELMEFACIEGNEDVIHYTEDKGGKAKLKVVPQTKGKQ